MSKVGITDAEIKKIQRAVTVRLADQLAKTLAEKKQAYYEAMAQVRESLCVHCARTHGVHIPDATSVDCLGINQCAMDLEEEALLHFTVGKGITLMQLRSELFDLENKIKFYRSNK